MKKIIGIVAIPLISYFLGLQILQLAQWKINGFKGNLSITYDFTKYHQEMAFFWLVTLFIIIELVFYVFKTFYSTNGKRKWLTREEKKRVSHLAKVHEEKKGLQRLEFTKLGINLENNTIRGYFDVKFNAFKQLWNNVISFLKLSDILNLIL